MVRDSAMVKMETSVALLNGTIADPLQPSFPQNGGLDTCCHLVNMTEDIDKAAVCCAGCHYEHSNVTVSIIVTW